MPREVSIHELLNRMDAVVAAVEAGERLTLTVDGEPVADIVPQAARWSPWVLSAELRRIRREAPADAGLLPDLREVRGRPVETSVRGG
jgi:prevent-host-death family protein